LKSISKLNFFWKLSIFKNTSTFYLFIGTGV
jgi:hypothetical protein